MTYDSRLNPDFSTLQKKLLLTDRQRAEAENLALECCRHDSGV